VFLTGKGGGFKVEKWGESDVPASRKVGARREVLKPKFFAKPHAIRSGKVNPEPWTFLTREQSSHEMAAENDLAGKPGFMPEQEP
jgi:hypothetical protein